MDGVEPLAQEAAQFIWTANRFVVRRCGEKVDRFDNFFVELDELSTLLLVIDEAIMNNLGQVIGIYDTAFEVITVDLAQYFLA